MKLALCHLIVCEDAPDMIIADEPTNNLSLIHILWIMQPEKLIIQCHLRHPLILFTMAK